LDAVGLGPRLYAGGGRDRDGATSLRVARPVFNRPRPRAAGVGRPSKAARAGPVEGGALPQLSLADLPASAGPHDDSFDLSYDIRALRLLGPVYVDPRLSLRAGIPGRRGIERAGYERLGPSDAVRRVSWVCHVRSPSRSCGTETGV